MKKVLLAVLLLTSTAAFAGGSHNVRGYTRSDGTYVQPHAQSNPDQHRNNNYSSQGNYNPNTGQEGKQRNEYSNPPQYNDSYNNGQGRQLNQIYGNPQN